MAIDYLGANTSPNAPSRSAQYSFTRVTAARSGSFPCWTATRLFLDPLPSNPTTTDVRSGQVIRIDLSRVAVRTVSSTPGSHRARMRAL